MSPMPRSSRPLLVARLTLSALFFSSVITTAQPATIAVDASEASRKVLHVRTEISAQPGPLTLLYPKWIPGEHAPTGPIANFVDFRVSAGGKALAWQRDPVEMYAVHTTVPPGALRVVAEADFFYSGDSGGFTSGPSATDQLAILSWNQVVIYAAGRPTDTIQVLPSLKLPAGWSFASALPVESRDGDTLRFAEVSLTTLIDSPVLIGAYLTTVDLGEHGGAQHRLSIAADSAGALKLPDDFAAGYKRLVDEALALFGARHYNSYGWLLALSDHVEHFGLEHHQSSDNRREEATLTEERHRRTLPGLLAHEYTHSWNGKYRRPAGLLSADYMQPMRGDLLWVYEGLTEYLGLLLPVRSGQWTPEYYRETMANLAATLDTEPGRAWRPLGDTATMAQVLYASPREWSAARRGTDFYEESALIWLEADTILRAQSGGKLSLDDFCHRFHGGANSPPAVRSYERADVVATLKSLVPYDWEGFLRERIDTVSPRAPLGGLEASGWRLIYNDQPNIANGDSEERRENRVLTFSLGLTVDKDGALTDVLPGSPAAKGGLVPGMKVLGIGGRVYSKEHLDGALRTSAASPDALEVVVKFGEEIRVLHIDYHGGPRYPHLERIAARPDVLDEVLKARAAH